ncbi:beta-ketoacyl reductase [Actinosynnema sp. NPDC023658]|uniref:acyl carrier protein n=1 Tax=Actinosynnema sp. NPDC023658 TaxID=3155465 RepID=UPI0033CA470C
MIRNGLTPLDTDLALALFDAAVTQSQPVVVAAGIDSARLRDQADAGTLPAVLRGLVRQRPRKAVAGGVSLAERLAAVPAEERGQVLVDVVRSTVAAVLDHPAVDGVEAERTFKELGFDSLTAVELRNRLNTATGLRLPATLVFDHPTPTALAAHLLRVLQPAAEDLVLSALDKLEQELGEVDEAVNAVVVNRLQALLKTIGGARVDSDVDVATAIHTGTVDDVLDFIDNELGIS